ncbi:DUF1080 domain-containing protein [Sphingomonas piscis]|uniref:DUF1080 domain-containing protein n=1 Tax=Sphingomonas piscis TaxID=2714943 RepID=A0A6G7YMA5_9SPHN|nr:DUF1080 domain-containing protein [Sphingomonas piscis]QIK77846.1 DUF1080 domain-containing protein [Sphingomonas piscis]
MLSVALALTAAAVAVAPEEKITAAEAAAIANDPPYKKQKLKIESLPKATGPAYPLFNGKDLNDWEAWLGYADPSLTYTAPKVKPLGAHGKGTTFKVIQADGGPVLFVDGKTWGSLVHKRVIGNYHLSLDFRWTGKRHAPRLDLPENNGLLYHSSGPHGAVFGTWMRSIEFEIMKGSTGMVVRVGEDASATAEAGHDPSIIYPKRRFMLGGKPMEVKTPAWNIEGAKDAEKPVGEWNKLDLYVVGDKAVHVVNGEPVMIVTRLSTVNLKNGRRTPLTRGRIQLQSEGAETMFRNIIVEPISELPKVVAE